MCQHLCQAAKASAVLPPRRLKRKQSEQEAYSPAKDKAIVFSPVRISVPKQLSEGSHEKDKVMAHSPAAGSLPRAFASSFFSAKKPMQKPVESQIHAEYDSAPSAPASTIGYTMSSCSSSASSEDEDLPEPKFAHKGSLPPGVARIYYDYSSDCLMRMYESGRTSPGVGSNGASGFRTFAWSDGQVVESEEANTLPIAEVRKKPAGCQKKPAAHIDDSGDSNAEMVQEECESEECETEDGCEEELPHGEADNPSAFVLKRPAANIAATTPAAQAASQKSAVANTASKNDTSEASAKAASAKAAAKAATANIVAAKAASAPAGALQGGDQEDDGLETAMFDSQNLRLTLATAQSYICGRVGGQGSRRLIFPSQKK